MINHYRKYRDPSVPIPTDGRLGDYLPPRELVDRGKSRFCGNETRDAVLGCSLSELAGALLDRIKVLEGKLAKVNHTSSKEVAG